MGVMEDYGGLGRIMEDYGGLLGFWKSFGWMKISTLVNIK